MPIFIPEEWKNCVPQARDDNYQALQNVLDRAYDQAAAGKGAERHANNLPFEQQPILAEARAVGIGFVAGQARKKILEATRCWEEHPDRAVADLLGAINYIAAEVIYIEEQAPRAEVKTRVESEGSGAPAGGFKSGGYTR